MNAMSFLLTLLLLFSPAYADGHINESMCDEINQVLQEFGEEAGLSQADIRRIAGNCYKEAS